LIISAMADAILDAKGTSVNKEEEVEATATA